MHLSSSKVQSGFSPLNSSDTNKLKPESSSCINTKSHDFVEICKDKIRPCTDDVKPGEI